MKNLFIDANIWLSLYHFTSDDLEQFGKLKTLIGTDIRLFIPSQILNEIHRNREAKIKDAFDKFEKFNLEFPTFCKNYDEYKPFYEKYKELKDKHKDWIRKIKDDILEQSLPADKVLDEFFKGVLIIECDQDTINKAVLRYNTGNPPGKDKKYGDAINWECLLNNVPDGEDLFFISADRDYSSSFDDKNFNPFLRGEWETKKKSNIVFFRSLVEFLNKHFKDIELKTEREKDDLIEGLERSRSFATTHAIVAQLATYSDWSIPQIIDLCRIALNNFQVTWILGDLDVNAFFKSILNSKIISKSDNSDILQLRNKIDEIDKERESDIEEIDYNELPF